MIATTGAQTPETLVKVLYDSLAEKQRAQVCFDWNHLDKNRGLLRTRLENNWKITEPSIKSSFYTAEQQHLIREIFDGMTEPGWRERWDRQLLDDVALEIAEARERPLRGAAADPLAAAARRAGGVRDDAGRVRLLCGAAVAYVGREGKAGGRRGAGHPADAVGEADVAASSLDKLWQFMASKGSVYRHNAH